jgi:molecular chaperone DnaK
VPVPADVRSEVEQAVAAVREAIKGEDLQRIRQAMERAKQAGTRLAEAISRASATQGADQGAGPGAGSAQESEPGVVDAEFEEVDKRERKAG